MFKFTFGALSRRVVLYFSMVLVQKACSLFLQPLLMSQFEPSEYGFVSQFSAVISLIVLAVTFSADEVVIRRFHQRNDRAEANIYVASFARFCGFVALMSATLILTADSMYGIGNISYFSLGLIFAFVAPLVSLFQKFLRTQLKTTFLATFNAM